MGFKRDLLQGQWTTHWRTISTYWRAMLNSRAQKQELGPCLILDQQQAPTNLTGCLIACPAYLSVQPCKASTSPTVPSWVAKVFQLLHPYQMHPIAKFVHEDCVPQQHQDVGLCILMQPILFSIRQQWNCNLLQKPFDNNPLALQHLCIIILN